MNITRYIQAQNTDASSSRKPIEKLLFTYPTQKKIALSCQKELLQS